MKEELLQEKYNKNKNLSGINLSHSTFLQHINLSGADLSKADISNCILYGVNFQGANLSGVDFSFSDLYRANFNGANVEEANFRGANLSGVKMCGAINLHKSYNVSMAKNVSKEIYILAKLPMKEKRWWDIPRITCDPEYYRGSCDFSEECSRETEEMKFKRRSTKDYHISE
jgi:hypothetical protein